ncbi:MAG TPA: hypothetical protein VEO91_07215 [Candidatus Limnocylindria bacterium]|nr:hypothetical protein [Candidatus Limnocylindria bacterium]
MHPTIGELIARDHAAHLVREADHERLAAMARSVVTIRSRTQRNVRRDAVELLRLGSRRLVTR